MTSLLPTHFATFQNVPSVPICLLRWLSMDLVTESEAFSPSSSFDEKRPSVCVVVRNLGSQVRWPGFKYRLCYSLLVGNVVSHLLTSLRLDFICKNGGNDSEGAVTIQWGNACKVLGSSLVNIVCSYIFIITIIIIIIDCFVFLKTHFLVHRQCAVLNIFLLLFVSFLQNFPFLSFKCNHFSEFCT